MSYTLLLMALVVLGGLGVAGLVSFLFSASTSSFAPYSFRVSDTSNSTSLKLLNINGDVNVQSWDGPSLLVNGTVTARGVGASTDAVSFVKSNTSSQVFFQTVLPTANLGQVLPRYRVDINVYVPYGVGLGPIQITNTNGNVQLYSINATSITLTTTNGVVSAGGITVKTLTLKSTNGYVAFSCLCEAVVASTVNGGVSGDVRPLSPSGSYRLTTTNGGIGLGLPASGSFKLNASTAKGAITTSRLGLPPQSSHSLNATLGTGSSMVILETTNGFINIYGL